MTVAGTVGYLTGASIGAHAARGGNVGAVLGGKTAVASVSSNEVKRVSSFNNPLLKEPRLPGGGVSTNAKVEIGVHKVEKSAITNGRAGRQQKLKEIANDPKISSADRGWIKQELKQIERNKRSSIRNPIEKDLAHRRGYEASKGYDYSYSNLQDRALHKLQHKYDGLGKKNKTPISRKE